MKLEGIHHITAITGDAPANVEFYVGVLGLRMVKRTVNQDDPSVYHLFYADEAGSPGADLTFFEYPGVPRGRAGAGMVHRIVHRVGERRRARLLGGAPDAARGVDAVRTDGGLRFADPEGLDHELVVSAATDAPLIADAPGRPARARAAGLRGGARVHRRPVAQRTAAPRRARLRGRRGRALGVARRRARRRLRLRRAAARHAACRARAPCITSRGRRGWTTTRPGSSASPVPARAPDAGHRPLLVPLGLLPRAERRAVRDRHASARASPRTRIPRTSASGSCCRRGSSRCATRWSARSRRCRIRGRDLPRRPDAAEPRRRRSGRDGTRSPTNCSSRPGQRVRMTPSAATAACQSVRWALTLPNRTRFSTTASRPMT